MGIKVWDDMIEEIKRNLERIEAELDSDRERRRAERAREMDKDREKRLAEQAREMDEDREKKRLAEEAREMDRDREKRLAEQARKKDEDRKKRLAEHESEMKRQFERRRRELEGPIRLARTIALEVLSAHRRARENPGRASSRGDILTDLDVIGPTPGLTTTTDALRTVEDRFQYFRPAFEDGFGPISLEDSDEIQESTVLIELLDQRAALVYDDRRMHAPGRTDQDKEADRKLLSECDAVVQRFLATEVEARQQALEPGQAMRTQCDALIERLRSRWPCFPF